MRHTVLATFSSGREANLATALKVPRKDGVLPEDGVGLVVAHHKCCSSIREQTTDQTSGLELKMCGGDKSEQCVICSLKMRV